MKKYFLHILTAVVFLSLSCQKELPNETKQNQLPKTRLWVTSDSTLNETVSRQNIHFYGEDPDGYITGFLIALSDSNHLFSVIPTPDNLTYSWTSHNDTTIAVPLRAKRSKFTIVARAVDNNLKTVLPNHARIKMVPRPYWDKNENDSLDVNDIELPSLRSAIDPTGAIQIYPIVNTPPKVQFATTLGDNPVIIEQPETTFTATTFAWWGTDPDGNQTLRSYRLALNDTTNPNNWFELPSSAITKKATEADTVKITIYVKRAESDNAVNNTVEAEVYTGSYGSMQLRGKIKNLKLNSQNVLYLQSKDLAGEYSQPVRMPSTTAGKWYVKKPQSKMLVMGDFTFNSNRRWIFDYYHKFFNDASILNGTLKDFDEFGFDRAKPTNYTYFLNPAFIKTLQLFDIVLWFTDVSPNISSAQSGLFYYTNTLNTERNIYGKVIFTTQFQASPTYDDLRKYNDFAPLDSISNEAQFGYNRLPVKDNVLNINTRVLPAVSGYPVLYSDSVTTGGTVLSATGQHTAFYKKLYKRTDSQYLYRLDSSRVTPPNYKGQLEIGIIDNNKRFVMFGLPLHLLNGWEKNLPKFFKKVIEDEFGLTP